MHGPASVSEKLRCTAVSCAMLAEHLVTPTGPKGSRPDPFRLDRGVDFEHHRPSSPIVPHLRCGPAASYGSHTVMDRR